MAGSVVIGGGINGAAAAYHLARHGRRVRLFEARRIAAMGSGWTLGNILLSGRSPAEWPLARLAGEAWAGLAEELGYETGYSRTGHLRLARSAEEVPIISALADQERQRGLEVHFLEGNAAIRQIAPAVSEAVLAALYCPADGVADPLLATSAYIRAAKLYGAQVEEGVAVRAIVMRAGRVAGVETEDGFVPAESVVLAAGSQTPALLRPLGLTLPMRLMVAPGVLTIEQPRAVDQIFSLVEADCAGRQQPDGRFRLTGSAVPFSGDGEIWHENALTPSSAALAEVRAQIRKVLPLAGAVPVAKSWGGLIGCTPDALPVIDAPISAFGLTIAAGFSGHGFGLAPAIGPMIAELSLGRRPSLDIAAFRLERFAGMAAAGPSLAHHG